MLYTTKTLFNLQRTSGPSNGTPESPPISSDEQVRRQRAFFRWEVYTCLFQISQLTQGDDRRPPPSTDPAPTYATLFQTWEIEEICCVGQFYKILIEEVCDRLEEDFVMTVKVKEATYSLGDQGTFPETEQPMDMNLDYYCLWWYDEGFKSCDRAEHIGYIVSRGTLSVWKLKHAPLQTVRWMIVRSQFESKHQVSILKGFEDWDSCEKEAYKTSKDCNFGWQWAVAGMEWWRPDVPANYELRNQGYVFWDQARLEKIKRFQSPRFPVEDLYEFPPGYQERRNLPGVETKLKNFTVHSKVIGEIADGIDGEGLKHYPDGCAYVIHWRS